MSIGNQERGSGSEVELSSFTTCPFSTWHMKRVACPSESAFSFIKQGWLNEIMDVKDLGQGLAPDEQLSSAVVGLLMRLSLLMPRPKGFASPRGSYRWA